MAEYCTFYKMVKKDESFDLQFKIDSCYSYVFNSPKSYDKLILAIPVDLNLLDDNFMCNTSWFNKEFAYKYLSLLEDKFGGIYYVDIAECELALGNSEHDEDEDEWVYSFETTLCYVIYIDKYSIKHSNQLLSIKYLLTLIRMLYEEEYVCSQTECLRLAKELVDDNKADFKDIITLALNLWRHTETEGLHGLSLYNGDYKEFDENIFKDSNITTVSEASKAMPVLKDDKILKLLENY